MEKLSKICYRSRKKCRKRNSVKDKGRMCFRNQGKWWKTLPRGHSRRRLPIWVLILASWRLLGFLPHKHEGNTPLGSWTHRGVWREEKKGREETLVIPTSMFSPHQPQLFLPANSFRRKGWLFTIVSNRIMEALPLPRHFRFNPPFLGLKKLGLQNLGSCVPRWHKYQK
jgi:hypothetical protein